MRKQQAKIKDENKRRRYRRKLSIRKKINGTAESPRISVTKTNKNLFVQAIDDNTGKTLFSVQTFGKNAVGTGATADSAKTIGAKVAEQLKSNKIERAVFDRNGNVFAKVLNSLVESIKENGIRI